MFNKKLKEKVSNLEERIWKLENPPKYKLGQKVDGGIVCEIIFRPKKNFGYLIAVFDFQNRYQYKLLKNGKIELI